MSANNILECFDILPNFSLVTKEMERIYELPHELPNDLRFFAENSKSCMEALPCAQP